MVQQTVQSIWDSWFAAWGWLLSVAWVLLIVLGVLLVLGLTLYAIHREGFERALGWVMARAKPAAQWVGLGLLVGFLVMALGLVKEAVLLKYNTEARAQYSSVEDPDVGPTLQYGPAASYISERTYTRTFTLPPDFLRRIGEDGVGILAPYLTDPSAENVTQLADTFRRSGRDVVFTREVTQLSETPITLENAEVDVGLRFKEAGPAGRRSFYTADYKATYSFSNPLQKAARVRFVFALPEQSGTLRDFSLVVNGTPQPDPDRNDNYSWEQQVEAGAKVKVEVHYVSQGSRSWTYNISSGRRPIKNFKLNLTSDRPVRFLRGALFPTSQRGNSRTWELKNVITAQQIEVFFPNKESRLETLNKVYTFLPLSLVLFVVWSVAWLWQRKLEVQVPMFLLATLGFAVGLGFAGLLQWYMPLFGALFLAALLAVGLVYVTYPGLLFPAAVSALLPLVFLTGGHAALLLGFTAIVVIVSLIQQKVPWLAR